MATTKQLLNDLINQRNVLAEALATAGVEVGENETFSTLVPKAKEKIESGGSSEYEELWNAVSQNGTRGESLFLFCNVDSALLDRLDLSRIKEAREMFYRANISSDLNLTLNAAASCDYMFQGVKSGGEINITALSSTSCRYMFAHANVKHITLNAPLATDFREAFSMVPGLLSVHLTNTSKVSNWSKTFYYAVQEDSAVTSITGDLQFITGVASNTFTVPNLITFTPTVIACDFPITSAKKLSLESAKNIINALVDYSGTENEFVFTVSLSEETQALLEAEGATAPNGKTWLEYAADKGWNV